MIAFLSLRRIRSQWRWTALWEHLTYMSGGRTGKRKWSESCKGDSFVPHWKKSSYHNTLKQMLTAKYRMWFMLTSFTDSSSAHPESLLPQCGSFLQEKSLFEMSPIIWVSHSWRWPLTFARRSLRTTCLASSALQLLKHKWCFLPVCHKQQKCTKRRFNYLNVRVSPEVMEDVEKQKPTENKESSAMCAAVLSGR